MKTAWLIVPACLTVLASCSGGDTTTTAPNKDALTEVMETEEDFEDAAISFENGGATSGQEYFFGVQAEVVEIDVKFHEIENLDKMNVSEEELKTHYDTMLVMIDHCKKALEIYRDKDWPKRQELHDLTVEWVSVIADIINEHLYDLAKSMATSKDQWSKEESARYNAYVDAYDTYMEVDSRWVDFQYEYAAANGFELSEEGIDLDALIEKDLQQKH